MSSKMNKKNLALSSAFLLLLLVGLATSDINQDKAECTDKLVALANCLPYVSGQSKAPAIDCCTGLKGVIDKSKRCLCLLIKDRDDPSLGLTIDVSLALTLPSACHTPTNITECVDLLHLAPNSKEAKVFEGLNTTAPAPRGTAAAGNGTGGGGGAAASKDTGTKDKSGGGWGQNSNWLVAFVFISQFLFIIL